MRKNMGFIYRILPAAETSAALLFIATALALSPARAASDPADISRQPLFQTASYDPALDRGRLSKAADAFGLLTAGNIYKSTAMDTQKELLDVLNDPDLSAYFPTAADKAALAYPLSQAADNQILAGGLTNGKTLRATAYLVTELAKAIVVRAMEGEGVTDKTRVAAWTARLLAPFEGCIEKAVSYSEAKGCKVGFRHDFPKNLGLALTFELSRQNLGERYTAGRVKNYYDCVTAPAAANPTIRDCATNALRQGTLEFVTDELNEAAGAKLPGSRASLVNDSLAGLKECLAQASDRAGFLSCTDTVEIQAGQTIVRERILQDAEIARQIPALADRQDIAASGTRDFAACMRRTQQADTREESGKLVTADCERYLTNRVAKAVSIASFSRNIKEMLPGDERQKTNLFRLAESAIADCWSDTAATRENSSCVAGVIKTVAAKIASARLSAEIPAALARKSPRFKQDLLDGARSCLESSLPADLLLSPDTNAAIDRCSSSLMRSAALGIAEFQLRQQTEGNLPKSSSDRLVGLLVRKDFASCLGRAPDRSRIDTCTLGLRQSAAKMIAHELFPQETDRYIQGSGGPQHLGLTEGDKANFLRDLLSAHDQCIDSGLVSEQKAGAAEEALSLCYRSSMSSMAKFLGTATFRKLSGENLTGAMASQQKPLQARFEGEFSGCVEGANAPGKSPLAYKKDIESCSQLLSNRYAALIGRLRVADAIKQSIEPRDTAALSRAQGLENELNEEFQACLTNEAKDSTSRKKCIARLERRATLEIVLLSGRSRLKSQLATTAVPHSIQELEKSFKACVEAAAFAPKTCARSFIVDFAREAGSLRVRSTLGDVLGAKEFQGALPEITRLETIYQQCLRGIRQTELNQKLLEAVQSCAQELESGAIGFVQKKSKDWMISRGDSEKVRALKEEIAIAIPCLAAALPPGPASDSSLRAVDPDGILRLLVTNISEYVNYDADAAKASFDTILAKLVEDMKSAGPEAARADLVSLLADKGVLDQLAKALVRKEIKAAFAQVNARDRPGAALEARLLSKQNFDKLFSSEVMAGLRPQITEKILSPILIQGKNARSPEVLAAKDKLKRAIAHTLLKSPRFGGALLRDAVQRRMDGQDGFTQFFANLLYGGHSLDWSYVRKTPAGQVAETYIREKILAPRFLNQSVPASEDARRRKQAEDLVKKAVTGG